MMNILFVVHYFPPQNNTGTRRVLAFCKYLHLDGHQVSVITTKKSYFESASLTEAVPDYINLYEVQSRNKYNSQESQVNYNDATQIRSWKTRVGDILRKCKRLSMKVFGQLVDSRIPFALSFRRPISDLKLHAALLNADIIISSAPPWPVHLATKLIAKRYKKPWIADYRDQFSGWHKAKSNGFSRHVEKKLDQSLISLADAVVTISEPMRSYYADMHEKVYCIENGFDDDAFSSALVRKKQTKIIIRYMGSIEKDSIPYAFIVALNALSEEVSSKYQVEFYGNMQLLKQVFSKSQLKKPANLLLYDQVSKADAVNLTRSAGLLFIKQTSDISTASSRGMLTTKLFEYMAARKGIIAEIDKNTLMADYIYKSGLSAVVTLDSHKIKDFLVSYAKKEIQFTPNDDFINQFSRKEQTLKLLSLVNEVLKGAKVNV